MSHTDGRFYPAINDALFSNEMAFHAQNLIRIVHDHIKGHLIEYDRREPNYEDYFACLKQIYDNEKSELVNPLISENVKSIKNTSSYLHVGQYAHNYIDGRPNSFCTLVEKAAELIQCVVHDSLHNLSAPVGFDLFSSVAEKLGSVDIFSLNHDLLFEKYFDQKRIVFTDGFGEQNGDIYSYNGSWNDFKGAVRLFKLHGSVDWYYVRFGDGGDARYVKKISAGSVFWMKDRDGNRVYPQSSIPEVLTGTTVKEQQYGFGLFGEIFEQFRHRLNIFSTLICSGYGWCDKGVNIRINQWLCEHPKNRVVILHGPSGENLKSKRFWYFRWEDYEERGKVVRIPKWLSECTIDDLIPYLQT